MIFNHLENDLKLKRIRLDHDYYAHMDIEEKFEVMRSASDSEFLKNFDISLGQLYEDWEFLESMMRNDSTVALMFEYVAPILRYIGYKALEQAYEASDGNYIQS